VADPWARLRHVRPREYAFADDFNAPADCLASLRALVAERMPDCPGLEEVDAILAMLPRFRPGDLVASRYYNLLVDALRKLRDYVAAYTPPPPPPPAAFMGLVAAAEFVEEVYEGYGLVSHEAVREPVTYDAGNAAVNAGDSCASEPVTYDAGNAAMRLVEEAVREPVTYDAGNAAASAAEEVVSEPVTYDAGNAATRLVEEVVSEAVTYNAGNAATNIGDSVST